MTKERLCVMCWHPSPPDAWRRAIPDGCHGRFSTHEGADNWRLRRLVEAGEIERHGSMYAVPRWSELRFNATEALEWWGLHADKTDPRIQCHVVPYHEHKEAATAGDASTEASV